MPGAIQPAHLDSREPASVSGFSEAEVSKTGFGLSALRLDFHNIILDKQKETGIGTEKLIVLIIKPI